MNVSIHILLFLVLDGRISLVTFSEEIDTSYPLRDFVYKCDVLLF